MRRRWERPEQAASGALDHVPPNQWPRLAHWLAALPDGSYWTGDRAMTRRLDDASPLFNAAGSVSGTLREDEIEWPLCAVHGGSP